MKPVAWKCIAPPCKCDSTNFKQCCYANYTAPRELSDEEIIEIADNPWLCNEDGSLRSCIDFARAILKKASEK